MKCVITVANYHGIGVDEEHLRHIFVLQDKNIEDDDILRIARHLKLKAKAVRTTAEALEKMPLPAILKQKDGTYALLARFESGKGLLLNAGTQQPFVLEKEELAQVWEGTVILCSPRAFDNKNLKFGIRWFMPTVLKFKKPLLEVLMAAFVMQILAVVSPLITQSVIDKVLVHGSLSTLDVLAVGLVLITIFETLLSLSRNYVFAHTTSRIDVILSCRLFRHLFHLPLSYFESHRIGDTIARVKELETIRRFLTGLPMSAMLDTLFIIVYLVFMFFYSTKLTFITLASLPVLVLVSVVSTPVLKGHIDDKFHCGAESQSYLVEAVTGIQTIKSYAIEPFAQKKWEGLLANYTKAGFKMTMAGNTAGPAPSEPTLPSAPTCTESATRPTAPRFSPCATTRSSSRRSSFPTAAIRHRPRSKQRPPVRSVLPCRRSLANRMPALLTPNFSSKVLPLPLSAASNAKRPPTPSGPPG